jgi:hypothetical protein
MVKRLMLAVLIAAVVGVAPPLGARPVPAAETLNAIGGLPAHLLADVYEPIGYAETAKGEAVLLDLRAHTIYGVNPAKTAIRKVIEVGQGPGKVLQPGVLSMGPADLFAVSDAPWGMERIQYFNANGLQIGGFYLNTKVAARLVLDSVVLNGAGTMQFTDKGFLISEPDKGSLVTELDLNGQVLRRFGTLRPSGHESDRNLHLAFNVGLPLAAPDGGTYFVFRTDVPLIRKYDASGSLVFERHIEGPELDPAIQSLPTVWPIRDPSEGSLPIVPPLVRTAAVDRAGNLWVSLIAPLTYVYDPRGEKIRTVLFKGASYMSPSGFFFTSRGTVLVTPGCYEFPAAPRPGAESAQR